MPYFRKKPVVIEAFMYGFHVPPKWFEESDAVSYGPGEGQTEDDGMPPDAFIETLEGKMRVRYYNWVIKGVKGELYPCDGDIFDETYEEIKQPRGAREGKK